jgi:prephenate dehydrogenase
MTTRAEATVGIVGLGLVGGSLARDLADAGWRVLGTDRSSRAEEAARAAGVVSGPVELDDLDVLVLATPVRATLERLRELAPRIPPGTAVTDVCSTKASVVEAAEAAGLGNRFVGSHPLAGDHRSGWAASRTALFRNAVVWLSPAHDADADVVDRVEGLWRAVGARTRRIEPHVHDRLMARASHLPQTAATALAAALARHDITPDQLGPGGRDMTRLAGSDPDMWADILVDNSDQVARALAALIDELSRFHDAVRNLDDATIRSLLAAGRAWSRGRSELDAGGVDGL